MRTHNLILKCNQAPIPDSKALWKFVKDQMQRPNINFYANEIEEKDDDMPKFTSTSKEDSVYIHIHFSHPLDLTPLHAIEVAKEAIKLHMVYSVSCHAKQIDILLH